MKRIIFTLVASVIAFGCTDINEEVYDKYAANDFYASPEGSNAALASVYAQIPGNWNGVGYAGADNGWYDLNCMSSDEQVIPHRNTGDWQLDFARPLPAGLAAQRFYPHQYLDLAIPIGVQGQPCGRTIGGG